MTARLAPIACAVALAACKQRGTIEVELYEPCGMQPASLAVYLKSGTCADVGDLTCGLPDFTCALPGCTPACEQGYCAADDLGAISIDPPAAGRYALIVSFRYPGSDDDGGLDCYDIAVDADGTAGATIGSAGAADLGVPPQCCAEGT